jgi:hypothetical protein
MVKNLNMSKDSKIAVTRLDKSFLDALDSYRKAIEDVEGYRMSRPQASARMAKKLLTEKKWW